MDVAAGLYGLIGNLGKSVGVSILVGFYVRDSQANRAGLISHVSPFNEAVRHTPLPKFWDMNGLSSLAALDAEVTRQASFMAYTNDFRLLTFIILACLPLVLLMRRPGTRKEEDETAVVLVK
jgi:DHA2 family multidrug resistance protein